MVVISTPGHTLGHQSVKVTMHDTGTVILTQDAVWMEENLEGYPAGLNYSILDYTNSVNRLKMMRDIENGAVVAGTQHQAIRRDGREVVPVARAA